MIGPATDHDRLVSLEATVQHLASELANQRADKHRIGNLVASQVAVVETLESTVAGITGRLDGIDARLETTVARLDKIELALLAGLRKTEFHLALIIVAMKVVFVVIEHFWRAS